MKKANCYSIRGKSVLLSLFLGWSLNLTTSVSAARMSNRIHDSTDPFVKSLERQYDHFVKAQEQGDLAAYEKYRTTTGIAFMKTNLERAGKLGEMAPMLRQSPNYKIRDFRFVEGERRDDIARLVYGQQKPRQDARGGMTTGLLVLFFRQEGGSWKVDNIGHIHSTEAGIKDLEDYPTFLLPGEFLKIKGSLRRLDLSSGSLSIQDKFGRLKDVVVKQNATVERKGQIAHLEDLQPGDEVVITVPKDKYDPFAMP